MKINMKVKNVSVKFMSILTIIALFVFLVGPEFVNASSSLVAFSDTMSREQTSTLSTHLIKFQTKSAIAANATIAITFTSFTGTIAGGADVQVCHGASGTNYGTPTLTGGPSCGGGETINTSGGASTIWKATGSAGGLTLTTPTGTMANPIVSNDIIEIYILANNLTNPSGAGTYAVSITNSNGDSGSTTIPILTSDQIGVSAAVTESVTFSINVGTANSGGINPIAIGTLAPTTVWYSNNSSTYGIWLNLATNTASGAVVTVQSANGDLKSTSTTDNIASATGSMSPGTANYGLCDVLVSGTPALTKVGNFANTCSTSSGTNSVGAVTTSALPVINTGSAPVSNGVAEVVVNAEDSYLTPAHSDYGDTLTFIATGTY